MSSLLNWKLEIGKEARNLDWKGRVGGVFWYGKRKSGGEEGERAVPIGMRGLVALVVVVASVSVVVAQLYGEMTRGGDRPATARSRSHLLVFLPN